jgi:hypothetical protein
LKRECSIVTPCHRLAAGAPEEMPKQVGAEDPAQPRCDDLAHTVAIHLYTAELSPFSLAPAVETRTSARVAASVPIRHVAGVAWLGKMTAHRRDANGVGSIRSA